MNSKSDNDNVAGHCIVHTYVHSITIIIIIIIIIGEEMLDTVCTIVAQLNAAITGYLWPMQALCVIILLCLVGR
jgi:hypothetical protein